MSPAEGLPVAALLLAAALVRPGPGLRRARSRWTRPRPRAGRRDTRDDGTAGARTAERAAALLRAGVAPASAWQHAGGGADAPADVRAVWRLVTVTGAPAAEALDACAGGVRADAAARAAVRTALAGARVSARTVSALPLLGLVLGAALGAPPWVALLGSAPGRLCAVAGGVLLCAGRWWSARLVAAAERAAG
ncbi:hypothetical protein [Kineococcus rhizosphaerae]|uniref:hypothetical protein n=1 Tax=Kineococcus rhizosphaerae TaxID=559628 RepID=UPI0014765EC4|nr:hypothetical protein [Kineococcus rhizosphaerae]